MKTQRQIVYDTLLSVCYDKAYSNLSIDNNIKNNDLDIVGFAFISALFYGVLERKITLDYIISQYISKDIKKIDKQILVILEMAVYQMVFMDKIPDNSAVDEAVKLVPYARKTSAKTFVNGVLRNFIRAGKKFDYPDIKDDKIYYYSIFYSCPKWLIELLISQYDEDYATKFLENSLRKNQITIRVNSLKTTPKKLIGYLEKYNVTAIEHPSIENCMYVKHMGSIDKLAQYKQGLFYVQDISSQLCVKALNTKAGEHIIDICSAPGSKTFTIAQIMQNEGRIDSFDIHDHKIKILKESAKRLGISIVDARIQDGCVFNGTIALADKVLCDVPCSGIGIISKKPEIKYKPEEEIKNLYEIQANILNNASKYLKVGGILVYSTCTLNKKENEDIILEFLKQNKDFKPLIFGDVLGKMEYSNEFMVTLNPIKDNCDGFFICRMQKIGV